MCNHAKYITDTATGYMLGNPVAYVSRTDSDITVICDCLATAEADVQDIDLEQKASIFGTAYEMVYMSDDESPVPKLANCDPRNTFVVYDNTVEHKYVSGVYYYPLHDPQTQKVTGYQCMVSTADSIINYQIDTSFYPRGEVETTVNPFGDVNIIEYYNNTDCQGDFEQVLTLIDAYNILQSDRLNDKQQFVEAILLIKGQILGDTAEEESEAYRSIRDMGVLMLDGDSSAEWLSRTFDEASVEVLKRSIEQDIHKFSGVPCITDENFVGNASGVAMKYKLLGLENVVKIKERYFKEGLKRRLTLLSNIVGIKGGGQIDINDINIKFTRSLPQNEVETAQIVATLDGIVPKQILLSILPFIDDPEKAMALVEQETPKLTPFPEVMNEDEQ